MSAVASIAGGAETVRIIPEATVLNPVSPLLYGQFLERASWYGEYGAERLIGNDGNLREDIVAEVRDFDPGVIRFPGGSFVNISADYEWTHLIDHAPGRTDPVRPETYIDQRGGTATTRMGFDEFMDLRDKVPFEPIIVVEFADALMNREPLQEAAWSNAAAMVAYFNGRLGDDLPPGMEAYVKARIANGRAEPYGVDMFQVGNEWFITWMVAKGDDDPDNDPTPEWAAEVFIAYVDAMKAVDPSITIIADGNLWGDEEAFLDAPGVAERIDLVAHHRYWPTGDFDTAFIGPDPVESGKPSATEWWRYWTTGLGETDPEGQVSILTDPVNASIARGLRLAITEWNWNGWETGTPDGYFPEANPTLVMGIGSAGYLHGMIRAGKHIGLATQSMFIGNSWNIPSIRVPDEGTPFLSPQGQVTRFYRAHTGRVRTALKQINPPMMQPPPFSRRAKEAVTTHPEVAVLDIVTTADAEYIYVHILHRDLEGIIPVEIDLSRLGPTTQSARMFWLEERSPTATLDEGKPVFLELEKELESSDDGLLRLEIQPRTINVVRIDRSAELS